MLTITAFLFARISEDEHAAHAVIEESRNPASAPISTGDDRRPAERAYAERLTPARIEAECEAKRHIVDLHTGTHECVGAGPGPRDEAQGDEPCTTLRALAAIYAAHDHYREAWTP